MFGLVLLCLLTISLFHREPAQSTEENASRSEYASGQNSLTRPLDSARGPTNKRSVSRVSAASQALTPEEAKSLAYRLANQKAKELYDCEPFTEWTPASLDETGWFWSSRRALGRSDIEATVRFRADGSRQSVDVFLLDFSTKLGW